MRKSPQPIANHYINGEPVENVAGEEIPVGYPATGKTIATVHAATVSMRCSDANSCRREPA